MPYIRQAPDQVIPLRPIVAADYASWLEGITPTQRNWLRASGFEARAGSWRALPAEDGSVAAIVFGAQKRGRLYQLAGLSAKLPAGAYALEADWDREQRRQAALGWGLAAYRFSRYRETKPVRARLVLDSDIATEVETLYEAQCMVRNMVNIPTEDMGPGELADAAVAVAERFGATCEVTVGDDLPKKNFPAIHAVGRAAARAPRFIALEWGDPGQPLLALAGKGVCFDSGGLDIKTAQGMQLMKKDMGGAAHALALGQLVMAQELPVRLLVLIPAVENAISGNAYRPGDVVRTRKGLTVEIGNTDAEGRVVLSDALAYACEHGPDLLIDFATLTGAARIAMGPDVPPIFSNRGAVARALVAAGERFEDPLWELPLYRPYRKMLKSEIADINNVSRNSYGGCITAALFLQEFVDRDTAWVHFDTFAWNQASSPGRPVGGEALGLRAAFEFLRERYG